MNILHVDSSILGGASASRQLTASIVASLMRDAPSAQVTTYDLAADALGHLTGLEAAAQRGGSVDDDAARAAVARNDQVLADFMAADTIVIGAPMYNFSLPSQLKAWLDRLAVAGRTFRYTAHGPEGLAKGKRVIVASTRGGFHSEGHPTASLDHQEKYLEAFFGFIGVTDLTFIRAEGLAIGPEARKSSIEAAAKAIDALAA